MFWYIFTYVFFSLALIRTVYNRDSEKPSLLLRYDQQFIRTLGIVFSAFILGLAYIIGQLLSH